MKAKQFKSGVWYEIPLKWRIQCCTCGMRHKLTFKVVGKKLFVVTHVEKTRPKRGSARC